MKSSQNAGRGGYRRNKQRIKSTLKYSDSRSLRNVSLPLRFHISPSGPTALIERFLTNHSNKRYVAGSVHNHHKGVPERKTQRQGKGRTRPKPEPGQGVGQGRAGQKKPGQKVARLPRALLCTWTHITAFTGPLPKIQNPQHKCALRYAVLCTALHCTAMLAKPSHATPASGLHCKAKGSVEISTP